MHYWGGRGQRVCWPQIIGGAASPSPPPPPPPFPTPMQWFYKLIFFLFNIEIEEKGGCIIGGGGGQRVCWPQIIGGPAPPPPTPHPPTPLPTPMQWFYKLIFFQQKLKFFSNSFNRNLSFSQINIFSQVI